jgi:hypothetical protein
LRVNSATIFYLDETKNVFGSKSRGAAGVLTVDYRKLSRDLDSTSEYRNGSANVLVMETDLAQLANDRFEIADALHRYAFGLDHGDADSLASALTEDCRFDFQIGREENSRSIFHY